MTEEEREKDKKPSLVPDTNAATLRAAGRYVQGKSRADCLSLVGKWLDRVSEGGKSVVPRYATYFFFYRCRNVLGEFQELQKPLKEKNYGGNTIELWKQHADYNRYNDTLCYDHSRVIFKDGLKPDYIHANYVHGYHRTNAYILTQGPLDSTICDFWRMVWQEKVATVVMVTRLAEKNKPKCSRYFPLSTEVDYQAGIFRLRFVAYENRGMCATTLLTVTNLLNDEVRHVTHIWYTRWPDLGIPDAPNQFRPFLNYVKMANAHMTINHYNSPSQHLRGPPMIIHCSAGIGRSAVIVVLDTIAEALSHNDFMDPLDLIKEVRKARYHAIHTKIQLLFVYDYVLLLASCSRVYAIIEETAAKVPSA